MTEIEELKTLPPKIQEETKEAFKQFKLTVSQKKKAAAKIIELYKRSLFEAGEAIGMIAAQSISEPATQMSIDAGERVIVKHDGMISVPCIGEFTDKILEAVGGTSEEGWETADACGLGLFVPAVTQDERVVWKSVLAVSRHAAPPTLLNIRTASGREITATASHSFIIRKNNAIVPVAGSELKTGERIPSMRLLPENCTDSIEVREYAEAESMKKPLPEKLQLSGNLGWVFGIYLAEGNCAPNYVSVSNVDAGVALQINAFAGAQGWTVNEYDNFRGFAKGHDIRINSTHLSRLLAATCGTGAENKRIPPFAYSAKESFVAGLLRGYFDGDGNVSVARCAIRISSNSKELIDGTALLLARFGIFPSKGAGKQFTLSIPHKYAKVFKARIGFSVPGKAESLDELCRIAPDAKQDYLDMFGGFGSVLRDAAQKVGYPTRYINNFTKRQRIGRSTLLRHIELFRRLAEEKRIDISRELSIMKRMAHSDVVWDAIESISEVRPTSQYVYDFTVEGAENFTTFDGIITHNTMRTYHVAGAAQIEVTLGLPRLVEIFDARRVPKTPTMTIYLKKNASKEKAKSIAAEIREVKLTNIATSANINLLNSQVEVELDPKAMKENAVKTSAIVAAFKDTIKGVEVKQRSDGISLKPKAEATVKELQKLRGKALDMHIKGLKSVSQAVVTQKDGEWTITTLGSNFAKVVLVDGVDADRTTTNNIHEIAKVLGIEAARMAIINEAAHTLRDQGLDVDVRHIMLVSDIMTVDGEIRAIGRYGISGMKGSVLARANFEETIKHLTKASVANEVDKLESIVENVMINQVVPAGTGMFDLVFKPPKKR